MSMKCRAVYAWSLAIAECLGNREEGLLDVADGGAARCDVV